MTNILIANMIRYIHYILIIYILIGFYITPIKYLHYYLLLIIFILLDWNDLDGQCILTKWEYYFRKKSENNKINMLSEYSNEPEFFRPIINKLFNINLTSKEGDRLNYFVFISCFLFGFIRLLNHYNIKIL
jgi:hypothetical protein